ncbi:D-alanine--D-alanine ligase [Wolbachia endosymbiont of Ctenocephalides felis wCfeT]|uniref:D-alanine--D-alanine ligase n=1 Tax=Wolbachia endosymbiont of Ctenocephalides felis wCfeT TaxID=2732593 RepID=UPI001446DAE7|nr:D-alanine--D-alanine ligase [Wolbachia endosymbiont of Ctenocephalides felis wCfeT]
MAPTIAVLSGELSREREVSLMSGKAVKKALDALSYNAIEVDVDQSISEKLRKINPDLAFIALHGPYGEDGCIQGFLEILGIKYTHSGVLASAIAMNKVMSKHIFKSLGIGIPQGYVISREDVLNGNIKIDYPYVLKPINEGSSIGVHIVSSCEDYLRLKDNYLSSPSVCAATIAEEMVIEEYIPGVELHTAVLLNEAIGTIEIRPKNKFYDYEAKYTDGFAEHIFPAEIPDDVYQMTLEHALKAHQFLGCKTISRSDFRYNPKDGALKMLEINTHPGFTELSLVPEIAKLTKGVDFNDLVEIIIEDSLQCGNVKGKINVEQCY